MSSPELCSLISKFEKLVVVMVVAWVAYCLAQVLL